MSDTKFDFNDILIEPVESSDIVSRQDINPFQSNGFLPLITAPMDTVISEKNLKDFYEAGVNICLPRGEKGIPHSFESYSLDQFKNAFLTKIPTRFDDEEFSVLIDTANGHIEELVEVTKQFKERYKNAILMVGNIANPRTYINLSNAGADYIRIGIGNGGGCLTTQQLGIGYPMGSLVRECYYASLALDTPAKIVADGGMKNYSDIIKALALGADYVMVGSIFNKALESAGPNYLFKHIELPQELAEKAYKWGLPVYKKFRGMSTKEVQKKWGATKLKTSEGVVRYRKIEYTLKGWVNNFESYLRSAMSYTNSKTLEEFIGNVKVNLITDNAYKRFNK